jgi:hypothetical protein
MVGPVSIVFQIFDPANACLVFEPGCAVGYQLGAIDHGFFSTGSARGFSANSAERMRITDDL